jgi:isoleucyl-tRNA synthetase
LPVKPRSSEKDGHQVSDIEIIKHLAHNNLLFAKEKIVHPYPHCMRCDTPIIYYALPSWFVNIQKVKSDLLKRAETMEWMPAHLKDGRFNNILEGAPDWTISRNRYWASPLPIWKSKEGKLLFVDSLQTLKEKSQKSGNAYSIMRHGQTEHNLKGLWNFGDSTDPLTEEGKKQVIASAQALKGTTYDLIVISPFKRTVETAQLVANELGISEDKVISDGRLGEWNVGTEFDGKPLDEYFTVRNACKDRYDFKASDGESYAEVFTRASEFLYDVDKKYQDKNILIISHGAVVRSLELASQGVDFTTMFAKTRDYVNFDNAEVRNIDFVPLPHNAKFELDFHRPYIDQIILRDEKGTEYNRIPEVIDCWFESGSMPFAQDHYPFERPNWHAENFPADFVVEYIAQTRTWFYYTSVVSGILFDHAPFKHVVTTGTLRAEDGQKISKSKKNYPDPWIFINTYGVDALRFYLMSGTLMKGEDANFSEKLVADIASKIIGRLQNVVTFYNLYREKDIEGDMTPSANVLDIWITHRLKELELEVTDGMDRYDLAEATRPFDLFIDDLSTWYLRRSRDRLKSASAQGYGETRDGDDAKRTLYHVLKTTAQLLAPFTPFVAEEIWQQLKADSDEQSVHLSLWPVSHNKGTREEVTVLETMIQVRAICTAGNALRKKVGIPVRQPLQSIGVKGELLPEQYIDLIKDELNVKSVLFDAELEEAAVLDIHITPELKAEGDYRELVRAVQDLRKSKGLTPSDPIFITLSPSAELLLTPFLEDFKKTVLAEKVTFAENDGEVITSGDSEIKASL